MRRMSFAATPNQIREKTKTVTRRDINTWKNLQPGDRLLPVAKCMGLKPGEKQELLLPVGECIEEVSSEQECIYEFLEFRTAEHLRKEMIKEGLTNMDPKQFAFTFFMRAQYWRRIEFKYVTLQPPNN